MKHALRDKYGKNIGTWLDTRLTQQLWANQVEVYRVGNYGEIGLQYTFLLKALHSLQLRQSSVRTLWVSIEQ